MIHIKKNSLRTVQVIKDYGGQIGIQGLSVGVYDIKISIQEFYHVTLCSEDINQFSGVQYKEI